MTHMVYFINTYTSQCEGISNERFQQVVRQRASRHRGNSMNQPPSWVFFRTHAYYYLWRAANNCKKNSSSIRSVQYSRHHTV